MKTDTLYIRPDANIELVFTKQGQRIEINSNDLFDIVYQRKTYLRIGKPIDTYNKLSI